MPPFGLAVYAPVPVLGLAVTFLIFYFSFIMYVSVAILAQARTEDGGESDVFVSLSKKAYRPFQLILSQW